MDFNGSVMLKTSDSFGEITDGHLDLSAPSIRTTIAAIMEVSEQAPFSSRIENSVYLQKVFPEYIMQPSSVWPNFRLDQSRYDSDLQVHYVVSGHKWWHVTDYGMYGVSVTPISLSKRTFRRIGMFDLLPKFRSSDQELDMRDVIKKEQAEKGKFSRQYLHELYEHRVGMTHPALRKGSRGEKYFAVTSVLEEKVQRKVEEIKEDVELYGFRIF